MRTSNASSLSRQTLLPLLHALGALAIFGSLAACTAETAPGEGAEHAGEALASGGGGGGAGESWACTGPANTCICTGDDDCNDMFSSGVCGDKAICQINSQDIPKCVCTMGDILVTKPTHPIVSPINPPTKRAN